jgi:excisionase family DNA binding protein
MATKQALTKQALLTVSEAAARKGVTKYTIYRRIRRGQLAIEKLDGKTVVDRKALDALEIPEGPWSNRERKNGKNGKGRK